MFYHSEAYRHRGTDNEYFYKNLQKYIEEGLISKQHRWISEYCLLFLQAMLNWNELKILFLEQINGAVSSHLRNYL